MKYYVYATVSQLLGFTFGHDLRLVPQPGADRHCKSAC